MPSGLPHSYQQLYPVCHITLLCHVWREKGMLSHWRARGHLGAISRACGTSEQQCDLNQCPGWSWTGTLDLLQTTVLTTPSSPAMPGGADGTSHYTPNPVQRTLHPQALICFQKTVWGVSWGN